MTNLSVLSLFFILFLVSSCKDDEEIDFQKDAEGVITQKPHQWRTLLSDNERELIRGSLTLGFTYNGSALFIARDNNQAALKMLSLDNGELKWQWNDFLPNHIVPFFDEVYQYGNYLVMQDRRRFYHLDLSNGQTLHKQETEYTVARIEGVGEEYFMTVNHFPDEENVNLGAVFRGKVTTGKQELMFIPPYTKSHIDGNGAAGFVNELAYFKDHQDEYLAMVYSDVAPDWLTDNYLGLYSLSKQDWVYNGAIVDKNVNAIGGSHFEIYQDKVYTTSAKSIACHDLYTGKQLWKKTFDNIFFISGFIIAEDKIIANNEDTYLYALDPETGQQLWKEKSSGSSSTMAYLNGVVYFTGGGDGLLHAVEVATGKHLWRIRSSDEEINRKAWFNREVMVIPPKEEGKKGEVIVSSYISAFCYEAAR